MIGIANAGATVKVNGQSTYRKGEYYQAALTVPNSTNVFQRVTNVASLSGTTNTTSGGIGVPSATQNFRYDPDGNLTNDGVFTYGWDLENRLLSVTNSGLGGLAAQKITIRYDSEGRRVWYVAQTNNAGTFVNTKFIRYVYDGWNLLAELNGTNNALINGYLWGADLSGSLQGAGGIGGLVAVKNASLGYLAPAYDGNGNVMAMIDAGTGASGGSVSASYEYGPFGEVIRSSGNAAPMNPFRFSTKYQDEETGLLYYGYRYYSPAQGRWISRDPAQEDGGLNLYGFVANDAIGDGDALGLMSWMEVAAEREKLEAQVSKFKCCCREKPTVTASIGGTAAGRKVTEKITVMKAGRCRDGVQIVKYYWWDCFTAQREAAKAKNVPSGRQGWQEYGWREGGVTESRSETGKPPNPRWFGFRIDLSDSNHWNWQAAILFTYCGKDGRYHAGVSTSNAEEWTWDAKTKSWGSPHNGNY